MSKTTENQGMPTIIGLTGHAGAGKDTVARLLGERFRVAPIAFADMLKHEIVGAFGIDRRLLDDPLLKSVQTDQLLLRNCTDPDFVAYAWEIGLLDAVSPRTIMQRWGDYRRAQDADYFVIRTAERLRVVTDGSDLDAVLLTDVRFQNEASLVRQVGGQLWRITRPDGPAPSRHASEWLLANERVDAEIVNDGSVEKLAKIATDLMREALNRRAGA